MDTLLTTRMVTLMTDSTNCIVHIKHSQRPLPLLSLAGSWLIRIARTAKLDRLVALPERWEGMKASATSKVPIAAKKKVALIFAD